MVPMSNDPNFDFWDNDLDVAFYGSRD